MWLDGGAILAGLLLLVLGGEALVRGACGLALLARLTPAVIGLTIVAAGTSTPELVTSLLASLRGSDGIAMGNVVGSNIFNILGILGLTAMVRPLRVVGNTFRMEAPVMILAAIQLHLLARDGLIDRLEAGALFVALVVFTAWAVWLARRAVSGEEAQAYEELATASLGRTGAAAWALNLGAVLLGVGLLAAGSSALVSGAVGLARGLGVEEVVIGLTIVAAGTSTPELVTSLMAARRGQDDIAIANIVGSNIFNVLGIVGLSGLVLPLRAPEVILARDDAWMVGASLLLLLMMGTGMRLTRAEGAVLFALFLGWTASLLASLR